MIIKIAHISIPAIAVLISLTGCAEGDSRRATLSEECKAAYDDPTSENTKTCIDSEKEKMASEIESLKEKS
jgi:hypothetical protein